MSANMNKMFYFHTEEERNEFDKKYEQCVGDFKREKKHLLYSKGLLFLSIIGLIMSLTHNTPEIKYIIFYGTSFLVFLIFSINKYNKACVLEVNKWWFENPLDESIKMLDECLKSDSNELVSNKESFSIRRLSIFENFYKFISM